MLRATMAGLPHGAAAPARTLALAFALALAVPHAHAQAGYVMGGIIAPQARLFTQTGAAVAACQAASPTTCSSASSLYVSRNLSYSTSTGVFTGTLTANACPSVWSSPLAPPTGNRASASCFTQSFPQYTGPVAAPLVGTVAYSLNGMNMCVRRATA